MSCSPRQLATILFLGASLSSLQAFPGANVPWTTYEAENMTINMTGLSFIHFLFFEIRI